MSTRTWPPQTCWYMQGLAQLSKSIYLASPVSFQTFGITQPQGAVWGAGKDNKGARDVRGVLGTEVAFRAIMEKVGYQLLWLAAFAAFLCLPSTVHAESKCIDLDLFLGNNLTAEMQEHLVEVAQSQPDYRDELCTALNIDCTTDEFAKCDNDECVTPELTDRESIAEDWIEEDTELPAGPGAQRACFYDPDLCSSLPPLQDKPVFNHTVPPTVGRAPSVPEQTLYSQLSERLANGFEKNGPRDGVRRRLERPPR